jgi:hypothetical protein
MMARSTNAPFKGRIQKRKTNHLQIIKSSLQRTAKRRGPPSQGWRTFLRNHAPDIAAMDLFVVRPSCGNDWSSAPSTGLPLGD